VTAAATGAARNSTESGGGHEQLRYRSQSPTGVYQPGGPDGGGASGVDKSTDENGQQVMIPEEEVELDLDDLTQEDKFYLI